MWQSADACGLAGCQLKPLDCVIVVYDCSSRKTVINVVAHPSRAVQGQARPLLTLYFCTAYARSYEAWIIYNFSALLLAYVGGPGCVVVQAEGKVVHPSWFHLTCCLPAMQVSQHLFFLQPCSRQRPHAAWPAMTELQPGHKHY